MNTNKELNPEELDVTLPSEILNQSQEEDDDSDMPKPETEEYKNQQSSDDNRLLLPTVKFFELFKECMGKLPYATVLKNPNNDQIKLTDLMKFVEVKVLGIPNENIAPVGITIKEMNTIISFVASAPFEYVRPLMEIVESRERQQELWVLKQ